MTRNEYQRKLKQLRTDVLYMSEVVAERLRLALDALERKDEELAQEVIEGDAEVNELYLDLEKDCINLIALQQPVAGDLRFIAASFKIITDLERIADLATNLGEYTFEAEKDIYPDVNVQQIGDASLEMLSQSMQAYETEDVETCYAVAERDDEVDAMCADASETVVRDILSSDEVDLEKNAEDFMQDVMRLLLTVRDLERVADHTVNIAARTLYMLENDDELLY